MSNHKLQFVEKSSGQRRADLRRLVVYCSDLDPEVRMRAVERLRSIASFDRPEVFMICAVDPDELVRIEALQALTIRKYAKNFLPTFVAMLNDKSDLVAAYAADGLRVAGVKSVRSLLVRRLVEAGGTTRASILGALHALGQGNTLQGLLDLLHSSDYRQTCFVANLLTEIRLTARERRRCVRALNKEQRSLSGRAPREAIARALSYFQHRNSKAS